MNRNIFRLSLKIEDDYRLSVTYINNMVGGASELSG